jgi:hypothetical protein
LQAYHQLFKHRIQSLTIDSTQIFLESGQEIIRLVECISLKHSFQIPESQKFRGLDLANKKDGILGAGNCGPKTERPVWHNEIWHCQRESQNVPLDHLDQEQRFRVRAIELDMSDIMPNIKFVALW